MVMFRSADMFVSGSDDGTVRHYDVRDPASATTISGMRTGEMIGEALCADILSSCSQ